LLEGLFVLLQIKRNAGVMTAARPAPLRFSSFLLFPSYFLWLLGDLKPLE
jgi:hypothetical protein